MVAPLWVNRDYLTAIELRSAHWQLSPLTMQNFVAIGEKMLEISAIENLCSALQKLGLGQFFLSRTDRNVTT